MLPSQYHSIRDQMNECACVPTSPCLQKLTPDHSQGPLFKAGPSSSENRGGDWRKKQGGGVFLNSSLLQKRCWGWAWWMAHCLSCPGLRRFGLAGRAKAPSRGLRRRMAGAPREWGSRRRSAATWSWGEKVQLWCVAGQSHSR